MSILHNLLMERDLCEGSVASVCWFKSRSDH